MNDLYVDHILDHAENPRGVGRLAQATHSTDFINASCGDSLSIELLVENGIIRNIAWQGEGCVISQAAASLLSESLIQRPVDEILATSDDEILAKLGLPEISFVRRKCALAFFFGVKRALTQKKGEA